MTERYCVPTSGPCRFKVVGLWFDQKTSRRSLYVICAGSNSTSTTSACPVLSVQTSSYVGLSFVPPVYPTLVDKTPFTLRKVSSTPQKQPAPNVAFSVCISTR